MTGRLDADDVARARAVPVENIIYRREIWLRRRGQELVGPCPVCGGTDRFAAHLQKQVWNCRGCQRGGDVIALIQHLDRVGFRDAITTLIGARGTLRPEPVARADESEHQALALRLWDEAVAIGGTLAERYLVETRRLALPTDVSPRVLRFHSACPFGAGARHPCVLALYRDIASDVARAIMRTALTLQAQKIDRKALGAVGAAAIKLSDHADVTMGLTVGEGLETTLAGIMKGFGPAWALGSAGAIAKFPVLGGIEALTMLAETGDGGANERATKECAGRWLAAGREVYRAMPTVGGDMNDTTMSA